VPLTRENYQALMATQPNRHAEWQVGRNFMRGSDFFAVSAAEQTQIIQATVRSLLPLYDQLIRI